MEEAVEKSGWGWGMKIWLVAGIVMVTIPFFILNKSRSEFGRLVCEKQCYPRGMDYKIVPAPQVYGGEINAYPGACQCIEATEKRFWEFWKTDPAEIAKAAAAP